jgi:transcriptional regulator with GAF, ATPase, and Fis domain
MSNNQPIITTTLESRYTGLLEAIEFFSQRFEIQQLIEYAYQFSDNLLNPDNIAVFTLQNNDAYTLSYSKGYPQKTILLPYSDHHNKIVLFYSGLLDRTVIDNFFPSTLYENYPFDFCIPLIMDTSLYGLICVQKVFSTDFSSNDKLIANALMNLFTTALTSYSSCNSLRKAKEDLNQKVFNLFAINHSTKALLSELSLDKLSTLAISVFSELTQSSITSFFLKDDIGENYILMGSKNIYSHQEHPDMIAYKKTLAHNSLPTILDLSDANMEKIFHDYFFNSQKIINDFNPLYIISLVNKDELLGFVTLGKKVNETNYDTSIFELIESLASATYVAVCNARYMTQINTQKMVIDQKLNELIKLNQLMKNINSAKTFSNSIKLLMDTLSVAFHVNLGLFATYDESCQQFTITNSINMNFPANTFHLTSPLAPLLEGDNVIAYETKTLPSLFNQEIINAFSSQPSGCILIPVYITDIDIKLLGVLGIFDVSKATLYSEENILIYESIANYIAPVLYQLNEIEFAKERFMPNPLNLFLEDFKEELEECIEFSIELYVIHISSHQPISFKPLDICDSLLSRFPKSYSINNSNCFIITNEAPDLPTISAALADHLFVNYYTLNKDFYNLADFKNIF